LLTSVRHIPIDRGGNEPRFEKLDNLRIVEGRRTVDDAVVSAPKMMHVVMGSNVLERKGGHTSEWKLHLPICQR
jgi:hypothetical protein